MDSRQAMRAVRLQEYTATINDQQRSGLSITDWCRTQGMTRPAYYRRLTIVKKAMKRAMLESMGLAVQAETVDMEQGESCGVEGPEDNLRYHTEMVVECQCSGLAVKDWCKKNNISKSVYYRWRKEVQEAALAHMGENVRQAELPAPESDSAERLPQLRFAELPAISCGLEESGPALPQPGEATNAGAAIRIQMGGMVIEIQKETDALLAESVVRALAKQC